MSQINAKQKEYHMRKLMAHFKLLDRDNTGCLTRRNFIEMAEKLKGLAQMSQREQNVQAVDMAFQGVSNVLKLEEGVSYPIQDLVKASSETLLSMSKAEARTVTDKVHNAIFDAVDANGDAFISLQEYKMYFYVLGHDISDEEIAKSFYAMDSNKDEKISRQEFLEAAFDFFFNVDESEVANVFLGYL